MTALPPESTPDIAALDLRAVLALYVGAVDADSPDAYEISDRITAEVARRRAVVYPGDSVPDLVRRYGYERYAEAVNGECGSFLDSLTSEVNAEELFAQITDRLAAAERETAEARETIAAQEVYRNAHRENADKIHAAAVRVNADLTAVRNMLADCVVKATEYGTQDGEFVAMYLLPTGPIHRAIPYLDSVGINVRPGFDGRKALANPAPAAEMVEVPAITKLLNYVGDEGTAYVPAAPAAADLLVGLDRVRQAIDTQPYEPRLTVMSPEEYAKAQTDPAWTGPAPAAAEPFDFDHCPACGDYDPGRYHHPGCNLGRERYATEAAAEPTPCCDMHNAQCEPPGDLCCESCTEAKHYTFPNPHADGSKCVLTEPDPRRTCRRCGTSWTAEIDACPHCQDAHPEAAAEPGTQDGAQQVADWNAAHPVGTLVRYWRGIREGEPSGTGPTRSEAWLLSGHTPVVLIDGTSGGIALTHVEVVDTAAAGGGQDETQTGGAE